MYYMVLGVVVAVVLLLSYWAGKVQEEQVEAWSRYGRGEGPKPPPMT